MSNNFKQVWIPLLGIFEVEERVDIIVKDIKFDREYKEFTEDIVMPDWPEKWNQNEPIS